MTDTNPGMNNLGNPTGVRAPRLFLIRVILLLVALGSIGFALTLVFREGQKSGGPKTASPTGAPDDFGSTGSGRIKLGIAYGTEKRTWMEESAAEFAKTPVGKNIDINLIPLGSLEAAQKIKQKDPAINVWSPASSLYKDVFVSQWQGEQGTSPILKETPLALSPMVFVMWEERYKPFHAKLGEVTFRSIDNALRMKEGDKTGWAAIADKPEWVFFKFSHTHPQKSNSGLMTLVLLAYDYFGKTDGLTGADLTSAGFQNFFEATETGVVAPMGSLVSSTGDLMDDMIRKGPSTYDAIFVYESVAIDRLHNAEGKWKDSLRIVYPKYNMWNDNPYYILDVPWSSPQQREAAQAFLDYLTSEPVQARAMLHGFRPASLNIATAEADSPFVKYKDFGLKLDLGGAMCVPPKADVINGLLERWQVVRGAR